MCVDKTCVCVHVCAHACMRMSLCMYVCSADMLMPQHVYGVRRTTLGVDLCLLPRDRALLLLLVTSLADLRTFKDSLVSASHLSLRTLGLQVYLLVLSSPWILESQTEVPSL